MKEIKLGLIPSPDLPAKLTSNFVDELPEFLSSHVDDSVSWKPEVVIDPLVGSAEYMNQLMNKAVKLKNKNNWDYVICLTDLPHFMEKHVVIADVNRSNSVALVSVPSFGAFPMKQRTKRTIFKVLDDMHNEDETHSLHTSRQDYKNRNKKTWFSTIKRVSLHDESDKPEEALADKKASQDEKDTDKKQEEKDSSDEQTQEDTERKSDARYIIKSKMLGRLRILAGMTFANRPWTALISFKKVLMLAFGTGIYMILFPTPWELSTIYSIPRFFMLMLVAISGMITWIIFAHSLWEKPTQKGDVRLRRLYNYTTITTLIFIVLINYIVLYCLFLAAIGIFVPPGLFEAGTDLQEDPSIKHYFQLTWLVTSLGTLAGSIGTTSENENKIRQITYSYRQINRYYEIQDNEDKNKDKSMEKSEHSKQNQLIGS